MQRNIYERVEVMFKIKDPAMGHQILSEVIAPYLADTEKTRVLLASGQYVRAHDARRQLHSRNGFRFNAQEFLIDFCTGRESLAKIPIAPHFMRPPDPTGPLADISDS